MYISGDSKVTKCNKNLCFFYYTFILQSCKYKVALLLAACAVIHYHISRFDAASVAIVPFFRFLLLIHWLELSVLLIDKIGTFTVALMHLDGDSAATMLSTAWKSQ